jgi:hypothetical protein
MSWLVNDVKKPSNYETIEQEDIKELSQDNEMKKGNVLLSCVYDEAECGQSLYDHEPRR